MVGLEGLNKYKKVAFTILALLVCLAAISLIKAFVQPANAMSAGAAIPIYDFYGDDKAYYCAHYSLHGSSVAPTCQSPEMAADAVVAAGSYVEAAYVSSCRAYDSVFRQYTWNVSMAEAICQAESGGNPNAVGPTNDYGLMQLHNMAILDPSQNIAAAYRKYQLQGWNAWTSYKTGAYTQFR